MTDSYFKHQSVIIYKFASDLQLEINTDKNGTNIEGCTLPAQRFFPDTLNKLQMLQHLIELSGKLAIEVELLYSGDQGQTNFKMITDALLEQYIELANQTHSLNKKEDKG